MEPEQERKKRVRKIISILKKTYPDARCMLDFSSPLELLVATILAAQCTDARVNLTTPAIFRRYRTAVGYSKARLGTLEKLFHPCGFFRNKAKAVKAACTVIAQEHGGEVPGDMAALSSLPGVGRKTANVVLGCAMNVPSLIVDTHVIRLSGRLGLASPNNVEQKYADKIESELAEIVPEKQRTLFSHAMFAHGQNCCQARRPECPRCPVVGLCPYAEKTQGLGIGGQGSGKNSE